MAAAQALMDEGLKVKIHVVGFDIGGSPEAVTQLKEVSRVGEGTFFQAEDAEGLTSALADAVKVTYSVYDENGKQIFSKPLSLESTELMSGTYRVEVALDPPLVQWVKIEKGKSSTVDVVRENKKFRITSPEGVAARAVPETKASEAETQPSKAVPAATQPETQPETQPAP